MGIALACLLSWLPARAAAQHADETSEVSPEAVQQARAHFEAARNHYEAGAYEAAVRELEAAYELTAQSALLYNLYRAHERAGNLETAADMLRRYVESDDVTASERGALQKRLSNLEDRIEAREAPSDDAADAGGGGDPAGTPAPGWSGGRGLPASAVVSFVVGGVGLATFGVFAGLSEAEQRSIARGCGASSELCDAGDLSKLRAFNIVADVALGVGLAAVATGLILWLVDGDEQSEAGNMAVVPWGGRERAGATAEVRF